MSKMAYFLHFLLMTAKDLSQSGQNVKVNLKDRNGFFQKMVSLIGFGLTVSEIFRIGMSKKLLSQQKNTEILYF